MQLRLSRSALFLTIFAVATGCGGPELGASTKCSDFAGLSGSDQNRAISAMLKSKGQPVNDESILEARGSAAAFCSFNPDRPISGIYGG